MHSHSGRISNISDHHDGKHVSVTVKHGKRKRATGATSPSNNPLVDYHQASSNVMIPKTHAKQFTHGQRVNVSNVSLSPASSAEDGDDWNDGTMGEAAPSAPARHAIPKAKVEKARGKIRGAMVKGKKR